MRIIQSISLALLSLSLSIVSNGQTNAVQTEKDFYSLKTIAIPQDIKLEVGGVAVMPDGRIAASTRRGLPQTRNRMTETAKFKRATFFNSLSRAAGV